MDANQIAQADLDAHLLRIEAQMAMVRAQLERVLQTLEGLMADPPTRPDTDEPTKWANRYLRS
jgi:outer membrane protein TolC